VTSNDHSDLTDDNKELLPFTNLPLFMAMLKTKLNWWKYMQNLQLKSSEI